MRTILVVEDEQRMRFVYARLLTLEGFRVLEASNCMEANDLLKIENVDLVLLDLRLPVVNGNILYDVMQMFHPDVKVIVSSVYHVDRQKKIISGASEYFDKSQGIDVLLEKINKVLEEEVVFEHVFS